MSIFNTCIYISYIHAGISAVKDLCTYSANSININVQCRLYLMSVLGNEIEYPCKHNKDVGVERRSHVWLVYLFYSRPPLPVFSTRHRCYIQTHLCAELCHWGTDTWRQPRWWVEPQDSCIHSWHFIVTAFLFRIILYFRVRLLYPSPSKRFIGPFLNTSKRYRISCCFDPLHFLKCTDLL